MGKYGPRSRNWENFSIVTVGSRKYFPRTGLPLWGGRLSYPEGGGLAKGEGAEREKGKKRNTGNEFVVVVWPHM